MDNTILNSSHPEMYYDHLRIMRDEIEENMMGASISSCASIVTYINIYLYKSKAYQKLSLRTNIIRGVGAH